MLRTVYTPESDSINLSIPKNYIGLELEILVYPTNEISICEAETKQDNTLSMSMKKAMDDEKNGRITKLFNHKNAVAEILG